MREELQAVERKRKRDSSTGKLTAPKRKDQRFREPETPKTREEEILDLQKEKLEIERDNLLLVQRKLQLEVALLEKQLQNTGGSHSRGVSNITNASGSTSNMQGQVVEVIVTDGTSGTVTVANDEQSMNA